MKSLSDFNGMLYLFVNGRHTISRKENESNLFNKSVSMKIDNVYFLDMV
jgi:hypothetical protein